jgi:hypothetical protein
MGHHQNEGPSETGGRSLASRCLLLPRFWAVAYGKSSWSSAEEKHLQACERCRRYAERVTREAQASVLRAFFQDSAPLDPGDSAIEDPPCSAANPAPPSCPRLVFRGHGWEAGSGERAWPAPGEAGPTSTRAPTPPRLGPWQLQSLQASRAGRLSSSGEHARQLALDLPPAAGRLVCTVYPDRRSEDEQRPYWAVTIALDSSAALSWLEVALQVGPATTGFRSLRAGEEETFEIEPPHDLPPRVHLEWECHGQQHTDQVELPLVDAR